MWVLAAMFASQLLQGQQKSAQLKTENKVAKANARVQDQLTEASNTVSAAAGALSRYKQSVSNKNIMSNAAQYNESLSKNLIRLQDQAQTGNINTRIQAAERTGQLVASASAAGVGGSTVDQINQVIKSQAARALQQSSRNTQTAASDTLDKIRQVQSAAINGMDSTVYVDKVTDVKAYAQQQEVPSFAQNAGTAALSVIGSKSGQDTLSGASSWFSSGDSVGANIGGSTVQAEGFNPAPATTNAQFFNVASMFGG